MGRTKQGGSILGYVIVGGVLTLLLLGGAYALRNNWAATPADTPSKVADQPSKSEDKPAQTDKDKASSPTPAPQPAPNASDAPSTTQLPQTGPSDSIASIAAILVVIASVSLYVQSRRDASASL